MSNRLRSPAPLGGLFPLATLKLGAKGDSSKVVGTITLRGVTQQDVGAYHRVLSNPAVVEYDDFDIISMAVAKNDIAQACSLYASPVAFGAEYPLAIDYTPEKGGDPVTAGFLYFTESLRKGAPAYMIGYHLDPEYQGMGIATQALQMFCHMVWAHSGGGRSGEGVFALVYKENIKSIKLLERCGFRRDSMYCILREVRGRVLTELRYYR